jgi:hypothetical protein
MRSLPWLGERRCTSTGRWPRAVRWSQHRTSICCASGCRHTRLNASLPTSPCGTATGVARSASHQRRGRSWRQTATRATGCGCSFATTACTLPATIRPMSCPPTRRTVGRPAGSTETSLSIFGDGNSRRTTMLVSGVSRRGSHARPCSPLPGSSPCGMPRGQQTDEPAPGDGTSLSQARR